MIRNTVHKQEQELRRIGFSFVNLLLVYQNWRQKTNTKKRWNKCLAEGSAWHISTDPGYYDSLDWSQEYFTHTMATSLMVGERTHVHLQITPFVRSCWATNSFPIKLHVTSEIIKPTLFQPIMFKMKLSSSHKGNSFVYTLYKCSSLSLYQAQEWLDEESRAWGNDENIQVMNSRRANVCIQSRPFKPGSFKMERRESGTSCENFHWIHLHQNPHNNKTGM